MNEAKKFDQGKEPMDLLPWEALQEVAKVLEFGGQKYGRSNWALGLAYSRLASASLRHIFKWLSGEDADPETGFSHLAHAICSLLFLLWMIKHRPDLDDRWVKDVKNGLDERRNQRAAGVSADAESSTPRN